MSRTRPSFFRLAPALAALCLTACDGGSSSSNDGIPDANPSPLNLASEQDIEREIGNFVSSYRGVFLAELGPAPSPASARSATVAPVAVDPRAAVTTDCPLGGTLASDSGSVSREFPLQQVSRSVGFQSQLATDCRFARDAATTVTQNGYVEVGGSTVDESGTTYRYTLVGRDGEPASERSETTSGASIYFDREGLIEQRLGSTDSDLRSRLTLRYRRDQDDAAGTLQYGNGKDAFVVRSSAAGLAFDGPYRYATRACDGGEGRLTTLAPLGFDENSLPVGGSLRIEAGLTSAQITFNGDGSASYQSSQLGRSGPGGAISREDIEAAAAGC